MTDERPGLWRNLLAMLYDTFLVAPLLMGNSLIMVTLFGPTTDVSQPAVPAWLMQSTSLVVIIAFFTLFWRKSGQTLGMQAWRIKLVDDTGEVPSTRQCVLRALAATLSLVPAGLGYWWSLIDRDGKRWHDRLTSTRLIKVPKKR